MTMERFTIDNARKQIRPRDDDSHKGSYGHGLLAAGCYGMAGAAIMAAKAALRSGIGLLSVSTPECNRIILQTAVPEAMVCTSGKLCCETLETGARRYSAIAVGPGLGTASQTAEALGGFLQSKPEVPVIIDADALNIVASWDRLDLLADTIITPHPGEFGRLAACDGIAYDKSRRIEQASDFAVRHNCFVILKGHATVVASPDGRTSVNTTGNPGMATGGSGDVLTGVLLALAAQGYSCWDTMRLGVFIHGLAGDVAARTYSQTAMTAPDIIACLPKVWSEF